MVIRARPRDGAPRESSQPLRPISWNRGDSPAVRAELRAIETTLAGLRAEWATNEKASALPPPRVHPAWVMSKLEPLDALLRRDPRRAKAEILKHLDGDLVIVPRPSSPGERANSLLRDQKAVGLQVVAGGP